MSLWKGSAIAMALVAAAIGIKLAWRLVRADSTGPPRVAVTIESKPLGAAIWLDGFPLGKVTPATLLVDNALPHGLELRLAGWARLRSTVSAGQPEGVLAFELKEAGRIQVNSDPQGARVTVDGDLAGTSPCGVEIAAGSPARVTAELEGFLPETSVVTVASREVLPWNVRLRAAGTLDISTEPTGLTATVDGRRAGETPLTVPVEADAPHRVETSLGRLRASATASVAARATRSVPLRIEDADDERLRASLRAVANRLSLLRTRIVGLERARPIQIGQALALTRRKELMEEEVDRLEQRQQDLEGDLGVHRTELEERARSAAAK